MSVDGGASPGLQEPATRGFLFADLRGYTDYVERHGDDAGAALLDRYRKLVREVVSRQSGAEVRTEGDSFYVLFPSASRAVQAALDIVAAAADETAAQPDAPIRVGLGVHAGETAETAEGPVGSAVNIAARICAQAKAGEVLASDTVRGLTRTRQVGTFEPVGTRRLKGIAEPMALYRVVPAGSPAAEQGTRGRRWLYAIAAVVAVASLLIPFYLLLAGGSPAPTAGSPTPTAAALTPSAAVTSPTPTAGSTTLTLTRGPLAAGAYASAQFKPTAILTLDEGWSAGFEASDYLPLSRTSFPDSQLTFHEVFRASSDGCFTLTTPLSGPLGLYDWMKANSNIRLGVLSHPQFALVDSQGNAAGPAANGWQVDIQIASGVTCPGQTVEGQYFFPLSEVLTTQFETARNWLFLATDQRARVIQANVPGANVTMIARTLTDNQLDPFLEQAEPIVGQVAFVAP